MDHILNSSLSLGSVLKYCNFELRYHWIILPISTKFFVYVAFVQHDFVTKLLSDNYNNASYTFLIEDL